VFAGAPCRLYPGPRGRGGGGRSPRAGFFRDGAGLGGKKKIRPMKACPGAGARWGGPGLNEEGLGPFWAIKILQAVRGWHNPRS